MYIDYEDLILTRQDLQEIREDNPGYLFLEPDKYDEDDPDSADCPIGHCWWDDIPVEAFYGNIS